MTIHRFSSMGCEVILGGASPAEARRVEQLFDERDRVFSRFRRDSELSRVNRAPSLVVAVSTPFAQMLEIALAAAAGTDGVADPTLGDAIEAAGYDRDFAHLDSPAPARAGARGCRRSIWLKSGVLFRPRGVLLDLNGVAKGKTVNDALQLLAGENAFVSAGGDLAARGPLDVALPGTRSLDMSRSASSSGHAQGPGPDAVRVLAGGLATSGVARRRWLRDGAWQHHLIDPRTGRPAESPWLEVTVGAATCLQADIAAKAAFLLGLGGPRYLEDRTLAARFLTRDGRVVRTTTWPSSLAPQGAAA